VHAGIFMLKHAVYTHAASRTLDLPWDWERGEHDINSTLKLRSVFLQTANMVPCLPIAFTALSWV
jgi:hypothetical protein